VLVLEDGGSRRRDEPSAALEHYFELMRRAHGPAREAIGGQATHSEPTEGTRSGTQEVTVDAVRVTAADGRERAVARRRGGAIESTTASRSPCPTSG
jgi:hypothetical protein